MKHEVLFFIKTAQDWIDLSLAELAVTFFSGIWNLGGDDDFRRFEIEFQPLFHSPSKTDGVIVRFDIRNEYLQKTLEFPSDYTSLANFISELAAAIDIEGSRPLLGEICQSQHSNFSGN